MKSLKEQFIVAVVGEAVQRASLGSRLRVLDLGCGSAAYVSALLDAFPTIEYVGVEPIEASYKEALHNLAGVSAARVHFQLGYDQITDEQAGSFDVVFSLSVLEHIKHLDSFLALGTKYTRPGGLMVHRYDLGHALHTHSVKEAIHVWCGNHFPIILPERQFVRYVPEPEVRALLEKQGVRVVKTTYHQMPDHKIFEKYQATDSLAVKELFEWEMKYQKDILNIPVKQREKLFPAVAVWAIR
jgi:2-polyprenyl-3-methyl-5-hydroxy-6-metoxy-1,4-benzoquinol methylase